MVTVHWRTYCWGVELAVAAAREARALKVLVRQAEVGEVVAAAFPYEDASSPFDDVQTGVEFDSLVGEGAASKVEVVHWGFERIGVLLYWSWDD